MEGIRPDITEAERFLTLLDEHAEQWTFQTFDDHADRKDPSLARVLHGSLHQHAQTLTELNGNGAGVFVTVNETDLRGRKRANILRVRALWQECDRGDEPQLPCEPHVVVESSPGKYHRYILADGAPLGEFEAVQQRLVQDYGSDPNASDLARVLRLPGFFHRKVDARKGLQGQPFRVRIIDHSGAQPLPWARLNELFPPVRRSPPEHAVPVAGKLIDNERAVREALAAIDPDIDYASWLRIGMALHQATAGGAKGLEIWDQWSERGKSYRPGETAYRWGSFTTGGNGTGAVTLASIFHIARDSGYRPADAEKSAPIEEARNTALAAVKDAEQEPSVLSRPEVIEAFRVLRAHDSSTWLGFRDSLKKLRMLTKIEGLIDGAEKKARQDAFERAHLSTDTTFVIRGGNLPDAVAHADALLTGEQGPMRFYQRADAVVRTARLKGGTEQGIKRRTGTLAIVQVGEADLVLNLTRLGDWRKQTKSGEIRINCPRNVAETYLTQAGHWGIPALSRIIEAPTLRPDGTLLDRPGYDPLTSLLFDPGDCDFGRVSERPNPEHAAHALRVAMAPLEEFPFANRYDQSVALAAILTGLLRRSMESAPLFVFNAHKMGSGKSLLADLVSLIVTGRRVAVMNQAGNAEEERKRILAALLAGDAVISIDNIERPLEGETLCSVLTQPTLRDRMLGFSKVVTVPTNVTWLATGNNVLVRGDLTSRVLTCTIDPGVERPEERRFRRNLYEWIPKHRVELVRALLTMMRGWYVAGCPRGDVAPFGRFETWEPVRHCLMWLGMPDPCLSRAAAESADPVRELLKELLHAWYERFSWREISTRDLVQAAAPDTDLHDLLLEIAADRNNRGTVSSRHLGRYLARHERRIEDGLRLEGTGEDSKTKVARWRVVGVSGLGGVSEHEAGTTEKDFIQASTLLSDSSSRLENTPQNPETPSASPGDGLVNCGDCGHFTRTRHPNLGHCAQGEPEAPSGLWDSDRRVCDQWTRQEKP